MNLSEFRARASRRQVAAYLEFLGPVTAGFLPALAARIGPGPGCALDLACGDGLLAGQLRSAGWQVLAIDRSRDMAAAARQRDPGPVAVADACALPIRDRTVRAVGAAFLLPHLPGLALAFAQIRRVLADGGTIALTGWAAPELSPLTGLLSTILIRQAAEPTRSQLRDSQAHSDPAYVLGCLRDAGFCDLRSELLSQPVAIASAAAWWTGLIAGTFGLSHAVGAQPPAIRQALRDDFAAAAADFSIGADGLLVPAAAHLISGRVG